MKILVATFSRSSLGHIIRSRKVAVALKERGHEVLFCCAAESFGYVQSAGLEVRAIPELPPVPSWTKISGEADLIALTKSRMANPEYLDQCLKAEESILEEFRPDVIVTDMRLTMNVLGSRMGIPCIHIVNVRLFNFPLPTVLPLVQQSLVGMGIREDQASRLLGDYLAIPGLSIFEPLYSIPPASMNQVMKCVREITYHGPLTGPLRDPENGSPHDSIYISFGGSKSSREFLLETVQSLSDSHEPLIVNHGFFVAESEVRSILKGRGERDTIFEFRDDSIECMAKSRLAIIHGGHGTVYECLSCGIPAIVVPSNEEQRENGYILEKLGIGKVLEPGSIRSQLASECKRMQSDPDVQAAASRVKTWFANMDGAASIARQAEAIGMARGVI